MDKQIHFYLFKLYHNEQDIENMTDDLSTRNKDLERACRKKEKVEEEIKEKKKEHGKMQREFSKIEQQIREAVSVFVGFLTGSPSILKVREIVIISNKSENYVY